MIFEHLIQNYMNFLLILQTYQTEKTVIPFADCIGGRIMLEN
jgi:hypothetical protein